MGRRNLRSEYDPWVLDRLRITVQILFRRIDLSDTSANALDALEQACDPAPFGRNHETVLDPTYRKAGKMDVGAFMIGFEPERYGLIEAVRCALFPGNEESKHVRAELYKLNVYGMKGLP